MIAAYQLTPGTTVTRTADGAFVPADPSNRDRQAYAAWLGAGNTPDPVPTPAPQTMITPGEFLTRFTPTEQTAIQTACSASPALAVGLTTALAFGYVDLASPLVLNWLAGLVAANALTFARSQAVAVP